MIVLALPVPPSTNNLFKSVGKRRVTSDAYQAWQTHAGIALASQRPGSIGGPVDVSIECKRGNRRRDIDNIAKAPLDLLVKHRVLADDSQVVRLSLAWADVPDCVVTVREAA